MLRWCGFEKHPAETKTASAKASDSDGSDLDMLPTTVFREPLPISVANASERPPQRRDGVAHTGSHLAPARGL